MRAIVDSRIPTAVPTLITAFLAVQLLIMLAIFITKEEQLFWLFLVNLVVYVALLITWWRRRDREIKDGAAQLRADADRAWARECDQE